MESFRCKVCEKSRRGAQLQRPHDWHTKRQRAQAIHEERNDSERDAADNGRRSSPRDEPQDAIMRFEGSEQKEKMITELPLGS
jgi:hypothetical protein